MSGGVDSSVAAALLKEAGYEVSGVHIQLLPDDSRNVLDLEHTCQILGIPLFNLNLEKEFRRLVIDQFCHEYGLGRTPNPCITCNQQIKFGLLLERVLEMGADYLATGHYARVEQSADGYRLLKAADRSKDQSYFLYTLGHTELQHVLLPLSDLRKGYVRKLAAELGLPAVSRDESQDVCFIPGNDYRSFIADYVNSRAGDIVDTEGKVLGRHEGLAGYTVGQRQGLGLTSNRRLYVIKLDTSSNRLIVGAEDQLSASSLLATGLSWVSGEAPKGDIYVTARVRYRSPEVAARLHVMDGKAQVYFHHPQRSIAPGQAVVFYQNETVLGGGIIEDAGCTADTILCSRKNA